MAIEAVRVLSGRIWWNDGLATAVGQPVAEPSGVIGTIRDQPFRGRHEGKQGCCPIQVMGLPCGQGEGEWPADRVGQGVNFSRPSAARPADGLLEVPPFAPAAERCALMWVLSTAVVLTTPL